MRRHRWRPGDDGISPVIGVVLLVGIAVTLMASIGVFVLGAGPGDPEPRGEVQFSEQGGNLTVTVVDGAGLFADDVSIIVGSEPACIVDNHEWSGGLQAGAWAEVNGTDSGGVCPGGGPTDDVVRVVWSPDGDSRSEVVGEYEML